ncbi:MAG: hypothetical protein ACXWHF_08725, partial [Chthoniobacterales bacterium]
WLFRQGNTDEALQVMAALPAEELQQPPGALYYCIFLAAAAHFDKAREYLAAAREEATLPEEKALLAKAQEALGVNVTTHETKAVANE